MRGFHHSRTFFRGSRRTSQRTASSSNSTRSGRSAYPKVESKRSYYSTERINCQYQKARTALACESSSLRYLNLITAATEDSLLRGWDDGIILDDDDGTWVQFCMYVLYVQSLLLLYGPSDHSFFQFISLSDFWLHLLLLLTTQLINVLIFLSQTNCTMD